MRRITVSVLCVIATTACGPSPKTMAAGAPADTSAKPGRPTPPLAKRTPDEVIRKLSSPTPAVAAPISREELIKRARDAAMAEGYPADKAVEVTVSVQGAYYSIEFALEKLPPDTLGGAGLFVLMEYDTGKFAYVHWVQ